MFDFISFGLKDLIDIAAVVFLVFQFYRLIRGTVAVNIFIGILSLFILWKVVEAFQMTLLSGILGQFMSLGVIIIVILFQQEIRRFLILIGTNNFFVRHFFSRMRRKRDVPEKIEVREIANACFEMAKTRTGALIVFKASSRASFTKTARCTTEPSSSKTAASSLRASSCPFRGIKTCPRNTAPATAQPSASPKHRMPCR